MYEFMHVCMNVCISLYTYVGVHACMCVRLANDFINVKTETKQLICCEEIPTFYRQARFLLRLQILPRSLPHTKLRHCRLTISQCYNSSKKIMYDPWNFGGAKSFIVRGLGGLAPLSPYVEPPLSLIGIIRSRQRNWLGHIMRGDSLLRTFIDRGKNGRETEKRKTKNDVTGLDAEGGLQQ